MRPPGARLAGLAVNGPSNDRLASARRVPPLPRGDLRPGSSAFRLVASLLAGPPISLRRASGSNDQNDQTAVWVPLCPQSARGPPVVAPVGRGSSRRSYPSRLPGGGAASCQRTLMRPLHRRGLPATTRSPIRLSRPRRRLIRLVASGFARSPTASCVPTGTQASGDLSRPVTATAGRDSPPSQIPGSIRGLAPTW